MTLHLPPERKNTNSACDRSCRVSLFPPSPSAPALRTKLSLVSSVAASRQVVLHLARRSKLVQY